MAVQRSMVWLVVLVAVGSVASARPGSHKARRKVKVTYDMDGALASRSVFIGGKLRKRVFFDKQQCGRVPETIEHLRGGKRHGVYVDRECNAGRVESVTRGHYCRGLKCGVWTKRWLGSRARSREVYGKHEQMIARTEWDDSGHIVERWTVAGLKRADHRACLRELKRGGCCDPEQNPPPGANMCVNGRRPPHKP